MSKDKKVIVSASVTQEAERMLIEVSKGEPFWGNKSLTVEDLIRSAYAVRVGTNVKLKCGPVRAKKKHRGKAGTKDRLRRG